MQKSEYDIITQKVQAVEYTDCFLAERGVRPPPSDYPEYDTKNSDGVVPVILDP